MRIKTFIALVFLSCFLFQIESNAQDESKDVNIGSKVLHQDGTDKNCFNNSVYTYEKVQSIDNLKKEDIYDKLKSWVISHYKMSNDNIIYDESNKESITYNLTFSTTIKKKVYPIQDINFKVLISIKEGKIKIQAKDFEFYGVDYSNKITAGPFNDLRPIYRAFQKEVYEEFDQRFSKMINGLTIEAFEAKKNDW